MPINNKSVRKLSLFLILQIILCFVGCGSAFTQETSQPVNLSPESWKALSDSGWPGASNGHIESLNNNGRGVRFNYNLKATRPWPWPEIDFLTKFDKPEDLRGYKGVRLNVKGKKGEEVYFYFLVTDNNIGKPKPVHHRIILAKEYQKVYLDFLRFGIAKDWTPRNPGFNLLIEWDKVEAVGLHKKGRDGEKGSVSLLNIEFLQDLPKEILRPERIRSADPEHFFIELKGKAARKPQARILINERPLAETRRISPYLYGANWGVWLDFPDKDKIRQLPVKVLRAGGPFMDRHNWRSSRYTFPGSGKPLLMRSLDDFIEYCHNIGAEPLIQINALGYGPDDKGSFKNCVGPDDAADLIRHLNKEKGYKVKFFEIGNEPFIWHNVHFDVRERPCSVQEYFKIFKEISVAIKKAQAGIDPAFEIKIFGPAISTSWLGWKSLSEKESGINPVEYFLKRCRQYQDNKIENPEAFRILDVLSFHLFPDFKNPATGRVETDIPDILNSTQVWWNKDYVNKNDHSLPQGVAAEAIPKFKGWIEKYYPETELAVTEFNIGSESMVDYQPIIKVLYLADLYGVMARYGLDYAAQFCLNSSDHHAAMIDDTDNITPLYYPMSLYAKWFKGVVLDVESSGAEALKVHACKNEDGLVIMAINKEKRPFYAELTLKEGDRGPLSFVHDFAPLSLTCIKVPLDKRENTAECWEYGEDQINGNIGYNPNL